VDYCNSLITGVADVHLCRLQSVQNEAARLVSRARRHDITPILTTLHWLPVRQRVIFKTAVPVWKCLHDVAPRYLADLHVPGVYGRSSPVSLCSLRDCHGAWTRTSTGQRSFAVYGFIEIGSDLQHIESQNFS